MHPIVAILIAALPFLVYFLLKKSLIKYFASVYRNTGVNPISVGRQILAFSFVFVPILGCINDDFSLLWPVYFGVPVIVWISLLVSNKSMKHVGTIFVCSFVQILFGALFTVRLVVWLMLVTWSFVNSVMWGKGEKITYNPFYITQITPDGDVYENNRNPNGIQFEGADNGIMNQMNNYTAPIDHSRYLAKKSQLQQELNDVRVQQEAASLYGFDTDMLNEQETQILRELGDLEKANKK